jgi:glutaryl-CoA dehydrogenase
MYSTPLEATLGLETGLGEAHRTDYFLLREELNPVQLDYLERTRAFVHAEVLPVINDYWERAEFPWPLARKLGEAGLVGDGIQGYGCPAMDPLSAGLVAMELNRGTGAWARSSGCRQGWRCARSRCSARRSRSSAGCRRCPGSSSLARSG